MARLRCTTRLRRLSFRRKTRETRELEFQSQTLAESDRRRISTHRPSWQGSAWSAMTMTGFHSRPSKSKLMAPWDTTMDVAWHYLGQNVVHVQDVVGIALALPPSADLAIREDVAVVLDGRVLNDVVEQPQLLPHAGAQEILVAVLGGDDDAPESACGIRRQRKVLFAYTVVEILCCFAGFLGERLTVHGILFQNHGSFQKSEAKKRNSQLWRKDSRQHMSPDRLITLSCKRKHRKNFGRLEKRRNM